MHDHTTGVTAVNARTEPQLTDTASTIPLGARVNALDDFSRKSVLMYLTGYAPEVVSVALDEIERQNADHARRRDGDGA
jgi:hypothetical protein